MSDRRHPNVVNLDELEAKPSSAGTRFGFSAKGLGAATGSQGIGCSYYEQPPGKTAFPRHWHAANEEALFVLEGQGTVHIGARAIPVRAGDYVTFLVGPDGAHLVVNTGSAPLRYLCMSTMKDPEVVGYPDSGKMGARASPSIEAARAGQPWLRHLGRRQDSVDYYDGEDLG
ncbi:MAG: cupin domain-containing protein [Deltaproteobacteria bacterium]|nr:cupin domain-containing protein [Deltaproteobacteria bacterium]